MSEKNKKSRLSPSYVLTLLICIAIGALAGMLLPSYFDLVPENHTTPIALAILVAYVAGSLYISIILHEGGHLVFGLITGYRFSSFRIGALMLVKVNGKLKFKRHSLAGTGGQCLLAPPEMKDGRMPHVLYNLGGVISNLVFAAAFFGLAYATRSEIYLCSLFVILAVINLTLGISNGIPLSTGAIDNDGKNAASLGKNPTAMRALWIQLMINYETSNGKRLSEMPEEWFSLPSDDELSCGLVASLAVFHENRLVDMMQLDDALDVINRYKSTPSLPGIYRSLMIMDEMTIRAINGEDYVSIARLFTKEVHTVMNAMKSFPAVLRTKYIFALLAEENTASAEKISAAFEKVKKSYPYATDIQAEGSVMALAKAKFEQRRQSVDVDTE